jgi:chromate reductase
MSNPRKVAVFVGSLRKESFSLKIAHALGRLAPPELQLEVVPIDGLAFYNQDLEESPLGEWTALRAQIRAADAVLFITPEYNRSVPAVLKNAIDVGSRPYGKSAWDGKPGAIISSSPGAQGGFGANHHLRQSLVFLNVPAMPQPEAYVGSVHTIFDPEGNFVPATRDFFTKYLAAFAKWIEHHEST